MYLMSQSNVILISLSIIYFFGVLGSMTSYNESLFSFTPFTLLLTFIGMISALLKKNKHKKWLGAIPLIAGICFFVEMLGVNTGLIFGEYSYLENLGWKLTGTPLLIGINWVILTIGSYSLVENTKLSLFGKKSLAAAIMVMIDVLIEGVAPQMGMWTFEGYPPIQNFIGWYLLSWLVLSIWERMNVKQNKVASGVLYIQFLFFVGMNTINLLIN